MKQNRKHMRLKAFILVCIMLISSIFIPKASEANAATPLNVTVEEAVERAAKLWTEVDKQTGPYGKECVNYIKQIIYQILIPGCKQFSIPKRPQNESGIAADLDRVDFIKKNFTIIYYSSKEKPQKGDIVVWNTSLAKNSTGHVIFVVDASSSNYSYLDWNGNGSGKKNSGFYSYIIRPNYLKTYQLDVNIMVNDSLYYDGYSGIKFTVNVAGKEYKNVSDFYETIPSGSKISITPDLQVSGLTYAGAWIDNATGCFASGITPSHKISSDTSITLMYKTNDCKLVVTPEKSYQNYKLTVDLGNGKYDLYFKSGLLTLPMTIKLPKNTKVRMIALTASGQETGNAFTGVLINQATAADFKLINKTGFRVSVIEDNPNDDAITVPNCGTVTETPKRTVKPTPAPAKKATATPTAIPKATVIPTPTATPTATPTDAPVKDSPENIPDNSCNAPVGNVSDGIEGETKETPDPEPEFANDTRIYIDASDKESGSEGTSSDDIGNTMFWDSNEWEDISNDPVNAGTVNPF